MKEKVALPSIDEQKSLQNVAVLMRTNLLTLQISELLQQVGGEKTFKKNNFHNWIEDLLLDTSNASIKLKKKEGSSSPSNEVTFPWLKKLKIPGFNINEDSDVHSDHCNVKIAFEKPQQLELIGSYVTHTSTAPLLNVDIAVVMPPDIFDHRYLFTIKLPFHLNLKIIILQILRCRDVLNHVYFIKRRLYLAVLAKHLAKQNNVDGQKYFSSFSWFKGDFRKPILEISPPANFLKSRITVRLIPTVSS